MAKARVKARVRAQVNAQVDAQVDAQVKARARVKARVLIAGVRLRHPSGQVWDAVWDQTLCGLWVEESGGGEAPFGGSCKVWHMHVSIPQ